MARQQFQQVAEQEGLVDVDEAAAIAQCSFDTEFGEGIGDDRGGCLNAAGDIGEVAAPATEKKFVSEKLLIAVQNGLAPKKKLVGGVFAHDVP